jgi:hypothetical protein
MTRPSAALPPEKGFALLVIFLIAAAVAFTMYQELPRAAFESARDKEQLLMDRGNQYKRAIQVFYAENKHYPAELKDLESTGNKRYLRRRYIDPMTGQDEWRLIHTNGSFLTDSLVDKPPAQNARGGLPGQGQTPGGGPLGANNMNSASGAATDAANNSSDPAMGATALNPLAQRRPSDRRFPTGQGFPQPPGSNPGAPQVGGANPMVPNSAPYDPSDPRTWPPITIATPTAQPGQPQPAGTGGQPARGNANQPMPGQFGAAQTQIQGALGQGNGQGGGNPQPSTLFNPNPIDPNGLTAASVQNQTQNAQQVPVNPNVQMPPFGNPPPSMPPQPPFGGGQASAVQANLAAGGFNPQMAPQTPLAGAQPNPALPGNNSGNAALNAIDNTLFRPNQAPGGGPTGSPGIAGVASKFKGPSIKAYREKTKYQEWEFVYQPATNQPGATQPGATQPGATQPGATQPGLSTPGGNQPGPAGAGGQNPQQIPGPFSPTSGAMGGAAPSNPFSMPNPFAPGPPPAQ